MPGIEHPVGSLPSSLLDDEQRGGGVGEIHQRLNQATTRVELAQLAAEV